MIDTEAAGNHSYAPPAKFPIHPRLLPSVPQPPLLRPQHCNAFSRLHNACSSAVNSRLSRADNARFIEQFRYVIVASQLLNEYLDHGPSQTRTVHGDDLDGTPHGLGVPVVSTSFYGAVLTATAAFALAYLIHWAQSNRVGPWSKSRAAIAITGLALVALVGYAFVRRYWLKFLRHNAVGAASRLIANVEAFELSLSSALSFIQEVELVSKGYKISSPLPPVSRLENQLSPRRCMRLRKTLHSAYASMIPEYIESYTSLRPLINQDDLEKYFDVYGICAPDATEVLGDNALGVVEDDSESLKSLRLLSFRSSVLRRMTLCSLMSLEADGGKQDFYRWRLATTIMGNLDKTAAISTERVRRVLTDMESSSIPSTPATKTSNPVVREKFRSQIRKISLLSSGIRGLQAKMHMLREETNRSIEQSDDPNDLGSSLMAQYDSIGVDLRELMQTWEAGRASLQSSLNRLENRVSVASSGPRSAVSSLGGLTAVEDASTTDGSPADALRTLTGDTSSQQSDRSSMVTTPSDEELVFEAVALPPRGPRRSLASREDRIARMHEERERQAGLRARRDVNTSMLRELESVINLRPKHRSTTNGTTRITSI